ncbi:MAG: hypothetical protein ACO3EK_02045, partial [Alphaproteobacteria bacterium]
MPTTRRPLGRLSAAKSPRIASATASPWSASMASSETRFSVAVTGFPGGKVAFQLQGKDYSVESGSLAGIVFGKSTGFAPDALPMPRVRVAGLQGLVLSGQLVEVADALTLRLDEGAEVALAAGT